MDERLYCREQIDALPGSARVLAVSLVKSNDSIFNISNPTRIDEVDNPGLYFYLCVSKYNYLILAKL